MRGKTHRIGATAFALMGFELMRTKGWLLPETNEFIQLAMMYPYSSWASIFPDLDHGKSSIPDKDPVSYAFNWFFRKILKTKHRSWQTHSIQYTLTGVILIYVLLTISNSIFGTQGSIGWGFTRLATMGFLSGVTSHLFLDALTTEGIYLTRKIKIHFTPPLKMFHSGGEWENFVLNIMIGIIFFFIAKIALYEIWGIELFEVLKLASIELFEVLKLASIELFEMLKQVVQESKIN